MKIAAILIMKDEQDIAYHTILHIAEEGVDCIIVADNLSTDDTLSELYKAKKVLNGSCHVEIVRDKEIAYYQSRKMTNLAHRAKEDFGCDWIIPADADELWYSRTGTIADTIKGLPASINVITAALYNHFPTSLDVDIDVPFQSLVWRQKEKGSLPKVAVKYHERMVIEQGNHSVTYPLPLVASDCLEIRHFPYRSWEQFKRKAVNGAVAYAATDLPLTTGQHWRQYGEQIEKWGDEIVEQEVFRKFFFFFSPIDSGLIQDPAPFRRWNKQLL